MSTRKRSGPRRRLDVLGDVGRAKLRAAVHRALAAAEGDYEVVAGLLGLPLSAVYALVEPETSVEDEVLEDLQRRTRKRNG